MSQTLLKVEDLHAYYGKSHVLHGVHFEVNKGEIVALLGRNGSGRSTTAKAIMGMVDCTGTLAWSGKGCAAPASGQVWHMTIRLQQPVFCAFRRAACAA